MIRMNFRDLLLTTFTGIMISFGCNFASCQPVVKQGPPVPVNFCMHPNEMKLYLMINEYRSQYGLPPIPLSKSLSYVAALHAKDLFVNHPDKGTCNFHSWSNKGSWNPFCYPKDENKKNSVWDKPRELTNYPSKAYEIVYWENNPLVTDTIIMVWKTEDYFNSFLLNSGKWLGKPWSAIGIAVYENYACAWFGDVTDPEGEAWECGSKPPKAPNDTIKPVVIAVAKPGIKTKKPKTGKNVVVKGDSLQASHADTLNVKPAEAPPVNPHPLPIIPRDSAGGTYYIIVKTSLPLEAARKLVATLVTGEYPGAKVLEKDGKIRVSVFESSDKATVMVKLKEVKNTYKDAWLLKR